MGSDLKKRQKIAYKREVRCTIRTKGERLGWEPLDNEKEAPLRTIVGGGSVVSTSCCIASISRRIIL